MAKRFLTLDIGAANIALAEYESGAKGALTLIKYGTTALAAPLDSGDAAAILPSALQEIIRENSIKPGPVAISVSGQMVFPRFAAIPYAGGEEKFEQMIRYEIEQNVPFPIDEMICDRQVLGDTENGDKSVMIVAAKTDQIEAITGAVTAAGFSPTIVDVAPIAVVNAVRTATADDSCVIVLDVGAKTTSLVISDGEKLYNRSIPVAGNNITREIATSLGCSQDEAEELKRTKGYVALGGVIEDDDQVADQVSKVCRAVMSRLQAEISRSVNFYRSQQGGNAPTKLYLTGGSALLPQIDRFFAENLQIEVEFFNPFDFVSVGPAIDEESLATGGALISATVGLALHQAGMAPFAINLLPPSIVAARVEKARLPYLTAAAAALLVGIGALYLSADRYAAVAENSISDLERDVNGLRNFENQIKRANTAVDGAKAEADKFKALLASRSAPVVRLNAVRSALAGDLWIERWSGNRITVRGWKNDVDQIIEADASANGGKRRTVSEIVVSALKTSPAVNPEGIKILDMSTIGKNGEVEQFTVEVSFK